MLEPLFVCKDKIEQFQTKRRRKTGKNRTFCLNFPQLPKFVTIVRCNKRQWRATSRNMSGGMGAGMAAS
ncbi:MAG TPA: hypothetical protein VHC39_17120 [Rhizomicrobium sp.]|nr:hypothetical protein [Rhizomicrobium sp.]